MSNIHYFHFFVFFSLIFLCEPCIQDCTETPATCRQDDVPTSVRRHGDGRPVDYLRQEFIERLQRDEPVTYQLQIQISNTPDRPCVWNPQLVRAVTHSIA